MVRRNVAPVSAAGLWDFFQRMVTPSFGILGLGDRDIVDYVVDMLVRFARTEQLYRIRNEKGHRLETIAEMMMELARYSEEGVRFLDGLINDTRVPNKEREAALQMLAHLPHAAAFNALIDFRDGSIMELDYPYDLVMRHIYNLDTAEIAPRIPELLDQIQYELGTDGFTPERPTVLFYLADEHNIRGAEDLLFDERILQDNIQGVMRVAEESHSKIGEEFIGFIAEHHSNAQVRNNAAAILRKW